MARYTNPLDLGYIRYIGYTNHHWTSDLEDLAEIWDMEGSGVYEPWQGLDCGEQAMMECSICPYQSGVDGKVESRNLIIHNL